MSNTVKNDTCRERKWDFSRPFFSKKQGFAEERQREDMFRRALEMFENAIKSAEKHDAQHLRFDVMESKVRLLSRLGERDKARSYQTKKR